VNKPISNGKDTPFGGCALGIIAEISCSMAEAAGRRKPREWAPEKPQAYYVPSVITTYSMMTAGILWRITQFAYFFFSHYLAYFLVILDEI
jgi:hypothetical protein